MIQYTLDLTHPSTHLFGMEISVETDGADHVDIEFPAWSPGRYFIYDFARNVQELYAVGSAEERLPVEKTAKGTWRIDTRGHDTIRARYRMFGDTLSGTFSQLDDRHAAINGSSVFGYVAGRQDEPIELAITMPEGWKVYTSLKQVKKKRSPQTTSKGRQQMSSSATENVISLRAENYDVLIDSPIEAGTPVVRKITLDGIDYHVVLDLAGSGATRNSPEVAARIERFVGDVEKTVRAQTTTFGRPEFDEYYFLVNIDPYAPNGDGMEHLASTRLVLNGYITSDDNYHDLVGVMSHEFFHIWNVKRLRPAELGPFDYTRERHTTLLWFAEGFTQYYGHLMLRRAGVWSDKELYKELADEVNMVDASPGRAHRNLRDSSFDTWHMLSARNPMAATSNLKNTYVNYYHKGAVAALVLDMEIRRVTSGRKSLDDVIRELYRTHYHEAEPGDYFLRGAGFTERDVYRAVAVVTGKQMRPFLRHVIESTEEIDYGRYLRHVGLEIKRGKEKEAEPNGQEDGGTAPARKGEIFTGLVVYDAKVRSKAEMVQVANVLEGSPAYTAGISAGDLIIAVDGERVDGRRWDNVLDMKRPGDTLELTLFRGSRLLSLPLATVEQDTRPFTIEASKRANDKQKKAREQWLDGNERAKSRGRKLAG